MVLVTFQDYLNPLFGGVLIGVAVTIMLLMNGRVTGISGIMNGLLSWPSGDRRWRMSFLLGLFVGGLILMALKPEVFLNSSGRTTPEIVVAGLLVGIGTIMGGGCTSGHGVCGISRFSIRSLVATGTFIAFGAIAVALVRMFLGAGGAA